MYDWLSLGNCMVGLIWDNPNNARPLPLGKCIIGMIRNDPDYVRPRDSKFFLSHELDISYVT